MDSRDDLELGFEESCFNREELLAVVDQEDTRPTQGSPQFVRNGRAAPEARTQPVPFDGLLGAGAG